MKIGEGFVPRASMFVRPGGQIIPPDHVVRRLQEKSPRLGLRWMAGAHIPYWGVTQRWAPDDPRWARVQSGQMAESEAFDIAHIFKLDVTGDDMAAYIEQRWSETAHRKEGGEAAKEAIQTVMDAQKSTHATKEKNVARATQNSLERHERESRHALRVRAGAEKAHPMIEVP